MTHSPSARTAGRALAWLTGTADDRARFVDVQERQGNPPVLGALVSAAVLAAAPTYGVGLVGLVALAVLTVAVSQRVEHRSTHREVPALWTGALLEANLLAAVLVSGGAASPLLPLTLVPLVTTLACFRVVVSATITAVTAVTAVIVCLAGAQLLPGAPAAPVWLDLLCFLVVLACVVSAVLQLARADRLARGAAGVDALTGLYNRRSLHHHHADLRAQADADVRVLGAVAFDVDRFKAVNDENGHQRGDEVLCEVARRAAAAARPSTLVYRTGGEEFLVLLPGVDAAGAAVVAERLRAAVGSVPVCGLPVTVSVGVSATTAVGADLTDLLRRADRALYRAKAAGRDRTVLDDDGPRVPGGPGAPRTPGTRRTSAAPAG